MATRSKPSRSSSSSPARRGVSVRPREDVVFDASGPGPIKAKKQVTGADIREFFQKYWDADRTDDQ